MTSAYYDIVILGLTVTSSWGNGHATTYRGLISELIKRGHNVLFLERNVPWYEKHRDELKIGSESVGLYDSLQDLKLQYEKVLQNADLVIVGSYVPDGIQICEYVQETVNGMTAFYDIDTPVTISKLLKRSCEYLTPSLIPKFDLYLSFAGGPILDLLEKTYGSPMARQLFCSVDPELYYPEKMDKKYTLGYMGTYSDDRQIPLERLMLQPARRMPHEKFIIAGPQYPETIKWPDNVEQIHHISPHNHRKFYCSQKYTLNVTREDMVQFGYAPSVRLFEAAACGTPIISDYWEGLNKILSFGDEILISSEPEHTINYLRNISESERISIGEKARKRILMYHTAVHRAGELEDYWSEALKKKYKNSKKVVNY